MTKYEQLLANAEKEDIQVLEHYDLNNTRLKGLYCNGVIALNDELKTESEKACVLAEELGHHYTTVGNILDQDDAENRKQELYARAIAYDEMIGLNGIISACKNGCRNQFEVAEHLGVTEGFLIEALAHYRSKHGLCATAGDYTVFFEPLGVLRICR